MNYYKLLCLIYGLFFRIGLSLFIHTPGYYHLHTNSSDCFLINGQRYRESTQSDTIHMGMYLQRQNYNLTTCVNNPINVNKIYGTILSPSCDLQKDILIRPNQTAQLCHIYYFQNIRHQLSMIGNFHIISQDPAKSGGTFLLQHNTINRKYQQNTDHFEWFSTWELEPGFHTISVLFDNKLQSDNYFCSCPSYYNGFMSTRYLFAWTTILPSKHSVSINESTLCSNYSKTVSSQICDRREYKDSLAYIDNVRYLRYYL